MSDIEHIWKKTRWYDIIIVIKRKNTQRNTRQGAVWFADEANRVKSTLWTSTNDKVAYLIPKHRCSIILHVKSVCSDWSKLLYPAVSLSMDLTLSDTSAMGASNKSDFFHGTTPRTPHPHRLTQPEMRYSADKYKLFCRATHQTRSRKQWV